MEPYLTYLLIYFAIALTFFLINSVIAGYNGLSWTTTDVKDSILWPASIAVLIGLLIRLITQKQSKE